MQKKRIIASEPLTCHQSWRKFTQNLRTHWWHLSGCSTSEAEARLDNIGKNKKRGGCFSKLASFIMYNFLYNESEIAFQHINRTGPSVPVAWSPRSPDYTPLPFLWDTIKQNVTM